VPSVVKFCVRLYGYLSAVCVSGKDRRDSGRLCSVCVCVIVIGWLAGEVPR